MADTDSNNENFWQSMPEPPPTPEKETPAVAPPPEVKVRTLQSDLESMTKSGGALPQFQVVRAPSLPSAPASPPAETGGKKLTTAIIVLVALALLGAIIYFSYQLFFNRPSVGTTPPPEQNATAPAPQPPVQPPPPPTTPPIAQQGFVHRSLFSKPADQVLTLAVRGTVESASDLQTFGQKVTNLLAAAKPAANLFEINIKNVDGKDLDVNEEMALADTAMIDQQFLSTHFNLDATFFIYKDKEGFWPGLITSLKPTENWLFLKNDVAKLEKSPKINNFFLSFPGDKIGDFKDDVVSGQPVRTLTFTAPGAIFIYGWFRGNLILSTSEEGLKQALARL